MGTTDHNNTAIGTLAVDGYSEERLGWFQLNVTAHPSAASVPTSYYSMWHYNYLAL